MDNRPIGVFDSGVGGLTVAREIIALTPYEKICYFGDSARAPYGDLPAETIALYARRITGFLMERGVKALAIACNTTDSTYIGQLRKTLPVPVVGVVEPAVDTASTTAKKSVGLLATTATVNSGAHERLLALKAPWLSFSAVACPLFVPIVENGLSETPEAYAAAAQYFKELADHEPDAIILGCTHYPYLEKAIRAAAGADVNIINPAVNAAKTLQYALERANLLAAERHDIEHDVFISGDVGKSRFMIDEAFGGSANVRRLSLSD
ncbi:MAG: glutamate racemase [Clostridiales bacterium]|nr:glutamate racemase [Clostridiales bacterium]